MLLKKMWIFGASGVPRFKRVLFYFLNYYLIIILLLLQFPVCDVNMYYFGLNGKK